jgi:polyphosphate glucokinase
MPKTPRAKVTKPKAHPIRLDEPRTLAIDIGGTGLKASVLDGEGAMLTEKVRVATPPQCSPELMVETLALLVAPLPEYHRVSVGFPGVVRRGRVITAHNLGTDAWRGFALDGALSAKLGKPVRVLNDADMQGLGAINGEGVEVVVTLGTGLGSSIFEDGRLSAHLELAHHPFRKGETYEEQLGNAALESAGKRRWKKRVALAIRTLRALTTFDHLHIGGGNARHLGSDLPPDVRTVSNDLGMRGGIWLWRERGPQGS